LKIPPAVKWGFGIPVIGFLALLSGFYIVDTAMPSNARRALPQSATHVQEYYSDSWNGDFVRLIRADLPEKDYEEYAKRLNLSLRYDETRHKEIRSLIEIGAGEAPDWWNPPRASATTFFKYTKGNDHVQSLNFKDGKVYYLITSW